MTVSLDAAGDDGEFALLVENAAELGLDASSIPPVHRVALEVADGGALSAISWGEAPAEVVMLHGGGQNAHTWDSLALALGRSALALDLPGHGHSYRRRDRNYGPWENADALGAVLPRLLVGPAVLVGMSLGGATALRLAATRPDLVSSLVVIDVTPQVNDPSRAWSKADRGAVALLAGPPRYDSFEEMAEAAVAMSPLRAPDAVRRGVRHNAVRDPDGSWRWRHDLFGERDPSAGNWTDFVPLWSDVRRITAPTMLVRGGLSKFVTDDDEEEMGRRLPLLETVTVAGAGHAVQSDQPIELARLIDSFAFARP